MHSTIDFFDGKVTVYYTPIECNEQPRRQREVCAVARLATAALGAGVSIEHNADGAPFVPGCDKPVSVSHSRLLAALAVGSQPHSRIGIDAEEMRPQLARVAPRVLSNSELAMYSRLPDGLLRAWTLKEALYKAAGIKGLDFASDIKLPDPTGANCEASVRGERFDCRFHYCGETLLCAVHDI